MDKQALMTKMGMNTAKSTVYKLNKITMSGDDGKFSLSDLLSEREKGAKVNKHDMGSELDGVILKMRWQLSRYDEPSTTFYNSTEYDDKWKDEVTVYPNKEKGSVEGMKSKHKLSTQRVIYFYVPSQKEIVRLIVKASALTGKGKNPNDELGLFEYLNEYQETETLPCQFITYCTGVFRAGKNEDGSPNKRKDHYAMTFKSGRQLTDSEFEKVEAMIDDVDSKTASKPVTDNETQEETDEAVESLGEAINASTNDINPDDIPF